MWRNIDSAVFLGTCQSKHMIVLINRSPYRTQRIMTIRQYIRHREFLKAGSSCCLDNSNKRNIMGRQFIKFNLQAFHISGCIMVSQNTICHCLFCGFIPGNRPASLTLCFFYIFYNFSAIHKIDTFVIQFHHCFSSCRLRFCYFITHPIKSQCNLRIHTYQFSHKPDCG